MSMSPFLWQCQNPCRLSLAFIRDRRVVTRNDLVLIRKIKFLLPLETLRHYCAFVILKWFLKQYLLSVGILCRPFKWLYIILILFINGRVYHDFQTLPPCYTKQLAEHIHSEKSLKKSEIFITIKGIFYAYIFFCDRWKWKTAQYQGSKQEPTRLWTWWQGLFG